MFIRFPKKAEDGGTAETGIGQQSYVVGGHSS